MECPRESYVSFVFSPGTYEASLLGRHTYTGDPVNVTDWIVVVMAVVLFLLTTITLLEGE